MSVLSWITEPRCCRSCGERGLVLCAFKTWVSKFPFLVKFQDLPRWRRLWILLSDQPHLSAPFGDVHRASLDAQLWLLYDPLSRLLLRAACLGRVQEGEVDEESRDRAALMQANKRSELKEGLMKGNRRREQFILGENRLFAIFNFRGS